MKYIIIFILVLTSCQSIHQEFNQDTIYLIVQSPKYTLYLPKSDIISYIEKNHVYSNGELVNYKCIKEMTISNTINVDDGYYLFSSDGLDKIDVFDFCALDLFKKHKILVYDNIHKKWIHSYKTRYDKAFIAGEDQSVHRVICNGCEIYHCR